MSKPTTGYVRQRKNGLWEGQYTFQREKRSIYVQTREAVSQQLEQIVLSIQEGSYVRPSQHTLLSWLREWLKIYAKPTLRPSTSTSHEFTTTLDMYGHTFDERKRALMAQM